MRISLRNQLQDTAEIDTNGALVRSLTVGGNKQLLFPAQMIGEKLRGGIPICAPIFGPGDDVGLRQHGFARDVEWSVIHQSNDEVLLSFDAIKHAKTSPPYQGCAMTYAVKIRENSVLLQLHMENHGEDAFVCSPGFHPYLTTTDATKATIRSEVVRQFNADELAATQFLPPHQEQVSVELGDVRTILGSSILQRYAVWSANPDRYICVEPTLAGSLADQPAWPLLQPGESEDFAMTLRWEGVHETGN